MKNQKTHRFVLNNQGNIEWLTAPPVPFKVIHKRRVRFSEIVPTRWTLFIAFRILRFLFGEEGSVAAWTRAWPCEWMGQILIGNHRGEVMVDRSRQAIIDWEHELFSKPKFKL